MVPLYQVSSSAFTLRTSRIVFSSSKTSYYYTLFLLFSIFINSFPDCVGWQHSVRLSFCLVELQWADSWHHSRNTVERLGQRYSAHSESLRCKCYTHTFRLDSVSADDMCLLTHTHSVWVIHTVEQRSTKKVHIGRGVKLTKCGRLLAVFHYPCFIWIHYAGNKWICWQM